MIQGVYCSDQQMLTLVVMAAGVGSRYGGIKQLAAVGPKGEAFLDFTIGDAVEAGVSKVVIVVRSSIEDAIRRHVESSLCLLGLESLEVAYICQDEHGPKRAKPWGTAHAALVAAKEVSSSFMICNADDYYGPSAFQTLCEGLKRFDDVDNEALLCGYRLGFTLPENGAVSRGVCQVEEGLLIDIVEHHGVTRLLDGSIVSSDPRVVLADNTVVSMNLWVFPPIMFDWIEEGFQCFLADHSDDADTEYILPAIVAAKINEGLLRVRTVVTDDHWTGITHPEDLPIARSMLANRF